MNNHLLLLICCGVFGACTSVTIRRPDSNFLIQNVCIQENPKVWVSDFLPVLKEGFARHGIATTTYSGTMKPVGCEYVLSYTALQSWDFVPYLSHAELSLENDGRQIGYAEYHLIGKGGFSPMKWEGTKTKMDPVIDDLLGHIFHPVVPTELPTVVKARPTKSEQSESRSGTESKQSSTPSSFTVKKFFADLSLYEGPIVGAHQITRAEFVETANGTGTVRLIKPGNNVLNGTFHSEPPQDQNLTVLDSKARNSIKLINDSSAGFLIANDDYGTRLECVYGTLALTGGQGGVCQDNRGNKYKLLFD